MFCPFVKGDCNPECVFNNGYGNDKNDPSNCNLNEAANMIKSFGFSNTNLEDYLENFDSSLGSITSNTGTDQSDSSSINSKLGSIEDILDEIKRKIK